MPIRMHFCSLKPRLSLPRSLAIPSAALTWLRLHSMCAWRLNPTRVRLRSMRRWPISIAVAFVRCPAIFAIVTVPAATSTVYTSTHMIIPKVGSTSAICPKVWSVVPFGSLPAAVGKNGVWSKVSATVAAMLRSRSLALRAFPFRIFPLLWGTINSVCISILPGGLYESHSNRPAGACHCRRVGHR